MLVGKRRIHSEKVFILFCAKPYEARLSGLHVLSASFRVFR